MHGPGQQHAARHEAGLEAAGDAEADDGAGAAGHGGLEQQRQPGGIAAARDRDDAGARGDAGFREQARDGEDREGAHMPTMTVREFECFRLRYRASAHSGKNFG